MTTNGTTKKRSSVVKQVTTMSPPVLTSCQPLTLGQQVAVLRAARSISQKQLARMADTHISVLRKIETDEGTAKIQDLQKVVKALSGVLIATFAPYGYVEPKEVKDLGMIFNIDTAKKEPTIFPPPFVPVDNNYAK